MQTELVLGVKLANIIVADCEIFLHDTSICDSDFTTGPPFTSSGRTLEKSSCAEEDAEPSSPANKMMRRTRELANKGGSIDLHGEYGRYGAPTTTAYTR